MSIAINPRFIRIATMRRRAGFVALLASILLISACDSSINRMRVSRLGPFPEAKMPEVKPVALSTYVEVDESGALSSDSMTRLNRLLQQQGRLHHQTLMLRPITAQGEAIAPRLAARLQRAGVPTDQIKLLPRADQHQGLTGDLGILSSALVVQVPDCRIAQTDTWMVKPYASVGPLGCATRANLVRMVADPEDLLHGKPLAGGDGRAAANSVDRYYEDDVRELLDIDFNGDD